MADSSGVFREAMLKWAMNIDPVTRPLVFYISFHTSDPGDSGANEPTTIFIPRTQHNAWLSDTADDGIVVNDQAGTTVIAENTANPTTFTHFGVWDSATPGAGQFYFGGPLSTFPTGTNISDNEKLTWADKQLIAQVT